MPRIAFDDLPDHGRLWVFPVGGPLSPEELASCVRVVDDFLDEWAAHGHPLRSGRRVEEGRFLLVGVDVDAEAPSGCSIDALVNRLRALGAEMGATFIDHAPVWFRDGEEVRAVSRAEFKRLAADGGVDLDTPVFDTTLTAVGAFRGGGLEIPARASWHGRAFFRETPQKA